METYEDYPLVTPDTVYATIWVILGSLAGVAVWVLLILAALGVV